MTYLFTICEYGGGEIASLEVTCKEEFAHRFEQGLSLRIDADRHYIVCEEVVGDDPDGP